MIKRFVEIIVGILTDAIMATFGFRRFIRTSPSCTSWSADIWSFFDTVVTSFNSPVSEKLFGCIYK
ncbi:MAG: hypothetical protein AAGU14_09440 [Eubacteriaceae bacterium]